MRTHPNRTQRPRSEGRSRHSRTRPAPPTEPRAEVKRVLVVDDEPIVRLALRETLRHQGYEVVAVEDSEEALEWIRNKEFSIILSDQQLKTQSGVELLAQAKTIQPNTVRILITAVLSLSMVIDAINKCEVYRFIMKPWLRDELLVTVNDASERYARNSLAEPAAVSSKPSLAA